MLKSIIDDYAECPLQSALLQIAARLDPTGLIESPLDQSAAKRLLNHIKASRKAKEAVRNPFGPPTRRWRCGSRYMPSDLRKYITNVEGVQVVHQMLEALVPHYLSFSR